MKHCPACDGLLDESEFSRQARAKDGLQAQCKACAADYREHWKSGRVKQTCNVGPTRTAARGTATAARKVDKRAYLASLKSSSPCVDCGVSYPPFVMDFDHVRGVKLFNLSDAGSRSIASIDAEVAKCDLVCSNCHRFRTFRRTAHTGTGHEMSQDEGTQAC